MGKRKLKKNLKIEQEIYFLKEDIGSENREIEKKCLEPAVNELNSEHDEPDRENNEEELKSVYQKKNRFLLYLAIKFF